MEHRRRHMEECPRDAVEAAWIALAVAGDQERAVREEGESISAQAVVTARRLDHVRRQDEFASPVQPFLRVAGAVVRDGPELVVARPLGEAVGEGGGGL